MAISSGRSYSSGAFALEIEGTVAGYLNSVEGGTPFGDVAAEQPGPDHVVHKHLTNVRYEDIVVTTAVPDGSWGAWLKGFLTGQAPQHDGAVVFLDYAYSAVRRLEFRAASIASVTFPRLDGAGREPGYLTVVLRPERTTDKAGSGKVAAPLGRGAKAWTTSNFVVEIPGVDCTKVSSVAALTVSQKLADDSIGIVREPTRQGGPLSVGDLVLTVSQSGAADFATWRDDFIIRGNRLATNEKSATVRIRTANLKDDVFALSLKGLGIHHFTPVKQVQGAGSIARVTASMYCEEAELVLPVLTPAPAPGPAPAAPPEPDPADGRPDRSLLGPLLGPLGGRRLEPLDIARRLRATVEPAPALSETDAQRQRGATLGAAWAERLASLDELAQLVTAGRGEWTALALPEGHSLIAALQEADVVPAEHSGDLELGRDSFVEGILDGAAGTYEEVRAHLEKPEP